MIEPVELAYIQKKDGEFINSTAYTVWEGFKNLGIRTEFFEHKQLKNGSMPIPLSKTTLIHGYIGAVRDALLELKVKYPIVPDYPKELESFLGRKVWTTTLSEIRKNEPRVFIKPKIDHKMFTGHVRTGEIIDLMQTAMCPDETEIYASEPVTFVSEYRAFINNRLIVGLKHYAGDFTVFPDMNIIFEAINAFTSCPASYSADFGITDDGRTLLVEINDAFSLGCYGLSNTIYAKMIMDRWEEMMNIDE